MNAAQYDSRYLKARSSASLVIPPLSSTIWSAFAGQAA